MNRTHRNTARVLLALYTLFCTITSVEARVCIAENAESMMESCMVSCCCDTSAPVMSCCDEEKTEPVHCGLEHESGCDSMAGDCSFCNDIDLVFPKPDAQTVSKRGSVSDIATSIVTMIPVHAPIADELSAITIEHPPPGTSPPADIVSTTVLLI